MVMVYQLKSINHSLFVFYPVVYRKKMALLPTAAVADSVSH